MAYVYSSYLKIEFQQQQKNNYMEEEKWVESNTRNRENDVAP